MSVSKDPTDRDVRSAAWCHIHGYADCGCVCACTPASGPVAGRFVLLHRVGMTADDDAYVTSWDTWEECEVAFPLERGFFLLDGETGREWLPGARYEWEAART